MALSIYAQWADEYGGGSAPMLGHISTTPASIILQYLGDLLGGSSPNDIPNIFNLLTGVLPDITIRVGFRERNLHSARLMQTAFHELGHGSHFQRAGQGYWIDFIRATIRRHPDDQCNGGYGCGNNPDDGNVQVGESWAEFIGTNHALRLHPNGQKASRWWAVAQGFPGGTSSLIDYRTALERETWFFNDWIPTGVYNDLMDVNNTWAPENFWDRIGGLSINQLYNAFGPDVDFMCDYQEEIIRLYPFLGRNNVEDIFRIGHNINCAF